MKIHQTIDRVDETNQRARALTRLRGRQMLEFNSVALNTIFLVIYIFAVGRLTYNILTGGLLFFSSDNDGYFVQLVWLGVYLWLLSIFPANWKVVQNLFRSRGRSFHPLPNKVEGLTVGARTVELTEHGIQLSMALERELIDWKAITDVFDDKGTYRLSSGFNYILSLPKTDDITAFLKARGFKV